MQVSAGQDGIQKLLQAEQEAQSIVSAARKGTHSYLFLCSGFLLSFRSVI